MTGSFETATESGDRLKSLEVLRDRIASAIDDCGSARDLAALSRQLTDVLAQIAEIESSSAGKRKGNPLDELAKRRASRLPETAN